MEALIINGWVICPICGSKEFPLGECKKIDNLRYKCKRSRGKNVHYMNIKFDRFGGK